MHGFVDGFYEFVLHTKCISTQVCRLLADRLSCMAEPVLRVYVRRTSIGFPRKTFDHKNGIASFIKGFWYGKY